MGRELDEAYFQSCECTRYEPLLGKMVQAINRLEKAYETGATVTVGATNTLDPGQEAYVVNSGTDKNARLQFGIPQGERGADGAPGAPGAKGDKGDSYTITKSDYQAIANIAEADLAPVLATKAEISSPAFVGIPTVPYPTKYNAGQIANMRYVQEQVGSVAPYPFGIDKFSTDDNGFVMQYNNGVGFINFKPKYTGWEQRGEIRLGDISFCGLSINFQSDYFSYAANNKFINAQLNIVSNYDGVLYSLTPLFFEHDFSSNGTYMLGSFIYNNSVGISPDELFSEAEYYLSIYFINKN